MDSSTPLQFKYEKSTQKIIFFDEKNIQKTIDFENFFDVYLSNEKFNIPGEEYSPSILKNFLSQKDRLPFVSFKSEKDNKIYLFSIEEDNEKYLKIHLTIKNDERLYQDDATDYLTKVHSRRYLFRQIKEELKKEIKGSTYLFMIDLDNFKKINDAYGHVVGDACLKEIAMKLNDVFRNHLFGRYGGDEFLAFAENIDVTEYERLINEALCVVFHYDKSIHARNLVTCSVGIVKVSTGDDIIRLIESADASLYQTKKHGKNLAKLYKGKYYISPLSVNKKKEEKKFSKRHSKTLLLFKDELKNKKKKHAITIVVTMIFFVSLLACLDIIFNIENNQQIRSIAKAQMSDTASSLTTTVEKDNSETFVTLESAINMLRQKEESTDGKPLTNYSAELKNLLTASTPAFLLSDGKLYLDETVSIDVSDKTFCKQILGNTSTQGIGKIEYAGYNYILHARSYDREIKDSQFAGMSIKAIVSVTDLDSYAIRLFTYLDKGDYAAIIKRDGSIICKKQSSGIALLDDSSNIFNTFEENGVANLVDELTKEMSDGKDNLDIYKMKKEEYFIYESPIKISDWHIIIMKSYDTIYDSFSNVVTFGMIAINATSGGFLILLLIALSYCEKLQTDSFVNKYLDSVTGVINEQRFLLDAKQVLLRGVSNLYLVYINIKRFKYINKQWGSSKGDDILKHISKSLDSQCNGNELLCREYSDHFIMLLKADDKDELTCRLEDMFSKLITGLDSDNSINLSFNAGIFAFSDDSSSAIWLAIDRAKHACDMVPKSNNDYSYLFFDGKMLKDEELSLYIEQTQESAYQEGKFKVFYQGKYGLKNDRFVASEALVRWKDDSKGFINTQTFIDVFEKNGFVVKLDLFVFEQVLKDIKECERNGKEILPVSVNISRKHFDFDNSFDAYENLMRKYDVDGKYLIFEITESVILNSEINLTETIDRIHSLGSKVSIDDFGSGFSNFALINHIDYDELKIDKRLLYGKNGFDEYSKNILKSIIKLNKGLKKTVICEGVEEKEESDFLKENGCDLIQGYYYAKPMPKEDFITLVEKTNDR